MESRAKMRKVGPSFRRIKWKTTQGFIEHWTEEPKRFRPSTRMPQFYNLTNQTDPHAALYERVELAGIAQYLYDKSVALDALHPADGYKPDVKRGKRLFSERGCLACHSHKDFPAATADFGPELSNVYKKIRRDEGSTGLQLLALHLGQRSGAVSRANSDAKPGSQSVRRAGSDG